MRKRRAGCSAIVNALSETSKPRVRCNQPASYETRAYGALPICEQHRNEGISKGLTLDGGDCWIGLSAQGREFFVRKA